MCVPQFVQIHCMPLRVTVVVRMTFGSSIFVSNERSLNRLTVANVE